MARTCAAEAIAQRTPLMSFGVLKVSFRAVATFLVGPDSSVAFNTAHLSIGRESKRLVDADGNPGAFGPKFT
jgi:hypothetical protein